MTEQDIEQLRLLSIFHYVVAGITALFGSFPLIHVALGALFVLRPGAVGGDAPPALFGVIMIVFGMIVVLLAWALAAAMATCGLRLAQRRGHTFCTVVAAIECVFIPIGTVLGVFTILVLQRPAVRATFQE
jgi:hypothetical protein